MNNILTKNRKNKTDHRNNNKSANLDKSRQKSENSKKKNISPNNTIISDIKIKKKPSKNKIENSIDNTQNGNITTNKTEEKFPLQKNEINNFEIPQINNFDELLKYKEILREEIEKNKERVTNYENQIIILNKLYENR
jgi:hypothetical protein